MVDLLVVMVVLAAVCVFVSAPLRRTPQTGQLPAEPVAEETAELRELEAERDAKLRELRDAELDHRTGKLSDEDYRAVDGALRAEAIQILRALDEARERASMQPGQDRESADTITD
ncbi:MAG TPA: hypothetical protein VE983_04105 [Solirubrobacteraceae bacterium]|nr:hypothetical protein [Solirubrobacteraceae bacterium]